MISLVRGKGLLNAIVIKPKNNKDAWDVCLKLRDNGLLVNLHMGTLSDLPPLTITEDQMMDCVEIIKKTLLSF